MQMQYVRVVKTTVILHNIDIIVIMAERKIGVLFDLDGVLVDSEGEYTKFWSEIGRRYNVGGETFASDIKGTTLTEILKAFSGNERESIVCKLHEFEKNMTYPWIPGADKFVNSLVEAGIPFAIVTSSDEVKMDYLFKAHPELKNMVSALVTAGLVSKSKPDPEGYLKGASMIGVPIEDCFVFEDSMQGLEAGQRSGATVIGLATTNPRERVNGKAHEIIDNFAGFTIDDMVDAREMKS